MITITQIDTKNISIVDNLKQQSYRGAAVYFAESQDGQTIFLIASKPNLPVFAASPQNISVNGKVQSNINEALISLNEFIGSFNSASGSGDGSSDSNEIYYLDYDDFIFYGTADENNEPEPVPFDRKKFEEILEALKTKSIVMKKRAEENNFVHKINFSQYFGGYAEKGDDNYVCFYSQMGANITVIYIAQDKNGECLSVAYDTEFISAESLKYFDRYTQLGAKNVQQAIEKLYQLITNNNN